MDRNIGYCLKTSTAVKVATREGGVDRNSIAQSTRATMLAVATREGGVDRNVNRLVNFQQEAVATREGGVDRNIVRGTNNRKIRSRHPRGWRG